ncbi:MAG: TPM domain-containing protein [Clostridiales bacterium]|nr:TPM domain-containing protein [Clostridiales bacterium]
MKKTAFFLLILLTIALTAQAFALQHVDDKARVLSNDEVRKLEAQAAELYERTQFDVILHTTRNSQGKEPEDYAYDYYHAFRDPSRYPDGAAFAIMFDTRDYYEAARGKGKSLLTYRENYDLRDVVKNKLSDGDYYGAFSDYLRYVKRLLVPLAPIEQVTQYLPFVLGISLVIGLIYAFVLKSNMKIAKYQYNADRYIVPNSLNLTRHQDLYLYQTVTRTKIESSSSGGSSGKGGGFSSGSRGGTSYGGRGGKF